VRVPKRGRLLRTLRLQKKEGLSSIWPASGERRKEEKKSATFSARSQGKTRRFKKVLPRRGRNLEREKEEKKKLCRLCGYNVKRKRERRLAKG